jgi:NADH-quinone oxidoreductase subunit N
MNPVYQLPAGSYLTILPELVLAVFGIVVMMAEPFFAKGASRRPLGWIAFAGALGALVATWYQGAYALDTLGFFNMVRVDHFSVFFHLIVALVTAVVILGSLDYVERQELRAGEYYALMLFGAVGMDLMSSGVELVLIFIALEISSISTYVLAGIRRRVATSAESSLKYFLLGSFATAFFLYGVSLMFGATGTTSVLALGPKLQAGGFSVLVFGAVALMLVGLGFKVAASPFHVWTPDVYEGAPAPVVAYMSTAPKAAAFAVLLRVLFAAATPGWFWPVWIAAALSMTLGNIGALRQSNIKRLLAYSSIAHAGYLLVAFASASEDGRSAAIFYAAAYAAMNVGAFLVIARLAGDGERFVTLDDYIGLGRRQPVLAATLTIFLLSLIGIPATGGFFAKFYVFSAALKANLVGLTILGLINSGIAAYYYLRVIVVMYMRERAGEETEAPLSISLAEGIALTVSVVATLYLGILPNQALQFAIDSARDLLK